MDLRAGFLCWCVYERRHELPEAFHSVGKHCLSTWIDGLLEQGQPVLVMAERSMLVKWLDAPDGPVIARGVRSGGYRARPYWWMARSPGVPPDESHPGGPPWGRADL